MITSKSTLSTKDIVIIVVIAVISGVMGAGWGFLWNLAFAIPVMGAITSASVTFVWYVAPLVSFYMIRKPRVAAMTQLLAGFIAILAGHPAGVVAYGWYVLEALGAELGFAAFRYKRWDMASMALAAILQGTSYFWGVVYFRLYDYGFAAWIWPTLATFVTAGFAAPIGLAIAKTLERTGFSSSRNAAA